MKRFPLHRLLLGLMIALLSCANVSAQDFQQEFGLGARKLSPTGESKYFILMPGFQTVLASTTTKLTITVLQETRKIGEVITRVVEEREEEDGALIEISRNFFAIDPVTKDVFYFGEEVDFYKNGQITGHAGSWLAFQDGNRPGMIMSGSPKVGLKYYQEVAPGVALDRAEVITVSENCQTQAGSFTNCLIARESSGLEAAIEYKTYAPGIGLVQDQALRLVSYGYLAKPR